MTQEPASYTHFSAWDKEYSHVKWGGAAPIEPIRSRIPEGCRILDAGSGKGRHLLPLSNFYDCTGIDVSPTALKASREYLAKRDREAHHSVSSITHLPFADNSFEGIVCFGVLQHLMKNEREKAVAEFKRVLKPGGTIFLEVFGIKDMRYGGDAVEPHTFVRQSGIIYHYFTKEEIENLFRDFGILDIKDLITEKKFRGELHTRHMINGTIQLASEIDAKIC
ncbi:bifunctional 2-polyprenyl-6-hydroxyphenol methylase/3-demethylubiquinol 3-O-methyltransferase UbiG [Methanococcoides methylutens]|uniref:LysM protein n=1 Tax=Methanococcoides methylutens MM1 TaxID=1434104 RepID=A0A0E3SQ70_METMT|nr:class I SAM-dependent methyltransferase [Methanococcoides methylutens]AKB84148.1 LysM protein [Methanococcoides methylutens MM1]